jgi:hypothetical protein
VTRILLISILLSLLVLAVAGWTVRGVRWAIAAPLRQPAARASRSREPVRLLLRDARG